MSERTVIVHKDKKTREIKTYVDIDGLGAEMSVPDFVSLMAEIYGSPATTFTKASFLRKLQDAASAAIFQMKMNTKEVAAINLEPPQKTTL